MPVFVCSFSCCWFLLCIVVCGSDELQGIISVFLIRRLHTLIVCLPLDLFYWWGLHWFIFDLVQFEFFSVYIYWTHLSFALLTSLFHSVVCIVFEFIQEFVSPWFCQHSLRHSFEFSGIRPIHSHWGLLCSWRSPIAMTLCFCTGTCPSGVWLLVGSLFVCFLFNFFVVLEGNQQPRPPCWAMGPVPGLPPVTCMLWLRLAVSRWN